MQALDGILPDFGRELARDLIRPAFCRACFDRNATIPGMSMSLVAPVGSMRMWYLSISFNSS